MHFLKNVSAVLALLALSSYGFAQIYESKDAEGNTVFTDVPTEGSRAVEVQPMNTADAPPDIPPAPSSKPAAATNIGTTGQAAQPTNDSDVTIIGDAQNERVERAAEERRREQARDAVEHHETGDGQQPEVLRRTPPAMQPHPGGRR